MTQQRRGARALCAGALAVSLVLAACGGSDEASDTTEEATSDTTGEATGDTTGEGTGDTSDALSDETLVLGVILEQSSLDPSIQANVTSGQLARQWSETLLILDDQYAPQPLLAESVEQLDDLTYQINLREGVLFHNGDELKASDVVFSLTRGAARPESAPTLGQVDPDGFEIIDDYTLTMKTLEPSATFIGKLAHDQASIVSEAVATERGDDFGQDVSGAGTGPFKFEKWTPGVGVTLTRNDDYWGEKAYFAGLEWNFVPDENSRLVMLETGQIDVMFAPGINSIATLEGNSDITVMTNNQARTRSIFFGQGEGMPFTDIKVRQAVSHAIDRTALVQAVFGDLGVAAKGVLPEGVPGYDPTLEGYEYDPERAVELLAEAGYGPGELNLTLTFFAQDTLVRIGEIIQANLAEVGVPTEIVPMEATAWIDSQAQGTVEFGFAGTSARSGDPTDLFYSRFHSENIPSPNHNQVDDPKVDELLETGLATFDPEERAAIYTELDNYIHEQAYALPFSHELESLAAQSDLEGIVFDRTNAPRFFMVSRTD